MKILSIKACTIQTFCNKNTAKVIFSLVFLLLLIKLYVWDRGNVVSLTIFASSEDSSATNGNYYSDTKYTPPEPIDVVYTWMNGTDENLLADIARYTNETKVDENRIVDNNELKYSLRSIEKYAPWVRHFYIVTNGQIPHWLNLDNPQITVVPHADICPPEYIDQVLPTFSSMAIETILHRIPGLSRRFLYFNDDFFLGQPLFLDHLRSESHGTHIFRAWEYVYCSDYCKWRNIGNGKCEPGCFNEECNYDGGDCKNFSMDNSKKLLKEIEKVNNQPLEPKLLNDEFEKSLVYTNKMLTKRFGYQFRWAISHTPLFLDTRVMKDLTKAFPMDFYHTMIHRTRNGKNSFQMPLLYFEFLLHEKRLKTDEELFDDFDLDKSGTWSEKEMEALLFRMNAKPGAKWQHIEDSCAEIKACSPTSNRSDTSNEIRCSLNNTSDTMKIGREIILGCPSIMDYVRHQFGKVRKYKASVHSSPSSLTTFSMIYADPTSAQASFDALLAEPKVFNCINNDIVSKDPNYFASQEYKYIIAKWQKMYETLFPVASQYELPHGIRNRFRYVNDYQVWKAANNRFHILVALGLATTSLSMSLLLWLYMRKSNGAYNNRTMLKTTLIMGNA